MTRGNLPIERLAQTMFLVVLAGFFAYHSLAAFEVIRPPLPLGGWWSLANAVTAACLGSVFLANREILEKTHWPFAALCLWVAAYSVWHRAYGNEFQSLPFVFSESVKLLIGWVAFYLLGFYLRAETKFRMVLLGIVSVFALLTPILVQTDPFSPFDDNRRRFNGEVANYQFFANALVFLALTAVGLARSKAVQGAILGVTIAAAFIMAARSEVIGLLAVSIVWLAAWSYRSLSWQKIGLAVGGLLLAVALASVIRPDVVERFTGILTSASMTERIVLMKQGLRSIWASPLLGTYAGQMQGHPIATTAEQTLAFGHYIHNVLGLWREFGLIPFLLFCGLSGWSLWRGGKLGFRSEHKSETGELLLYVAVYTTLLMLLSKSIYWPMPALAWGLASSRHLVNRVNERS